MILDSWVKGLGYHILWKGIHNTLKGTKRIAYKIKKRHLSFL